jgi:hypothetical protein
MTGCGYNGNADDADQADLYGFFALQKYWIYMQKKSVPIRSIRLISVPIARRFCTFAG